MRAIWWFKDKSIAGMARPGFNSFHWYDLPFHEAVLLGWLGLHTSGRVSLASFREHLKTYPRKVYSFYGMDNEAGDRAIQLFDDPAELMSVLKAFAKRTNVLDHFMLEDEHIHFEPSAAQLEREIAYLKEAGIRRIVTLTERHHHRERLEAHFSLHHIGIEDLGAPHLDQARELADVLRETQKRQEAIAVHCLAGIGRTSTMILAAHMLLGENTEELRTRISERNPSFTYAGPQGEFLRSIAVHS